MALVDIDKIINGTPTKRIINAYNNMKENYNEATAQEYKEVYSNEPLSAILENSRLIFSEPYYGLSFYKEKVENLSYGVFSKLYEEAEKVKSFIEENSSSMGEKQKSLYEDLNKSISNVLESTKNTRLYASYIKEHVDSEFEDKLTSLMEAYLFSKSDEDRDNLISLFESVESPMIYFTYSPYVCKILSESSDDGEISKKALSFCETVCIDESSEVWSEYIEKVICCNKLKNDSSYVEAVNSLSLKDSKFVFEYYMNESLNEKMNDMVTEKVTEDVTSMSPELAVNKLFLDMMYKESYTEENEKYKSNIDTLKGIAYESVLDILVYEYQTTDETDSEATGYTLLEESMSLEKAFEYVNNLYQNSVGYLIEKSDDENDDVEDDDIDNMEKEVNDEGESSGKKPEAPKAKNLVNKIQFKAMDKEAKQMKKMSERKQKGQEIGNAARAVAQIPLNVLNSIKDQVHKIDEKDDERRKNYMTEPGFRKKAFRNLKLAILYGSAANVKLAMVPVVAIGRHWSKQKDRRIRNETVREIQTEIKVCEEKISDANAAGDNKEKYRLMRIKDQLDAELVRVKTNSKYV